MTQKTKFEASDPAQRSVFLEHLVSDVEALESMLAGKLFETGITRFGVEQEMCLIDAGARPAMLALQILERLDDERFTTELARFNLEANMAPCVLSGNCLARLENSLRQILSHANDVAQEFDARILLTGILPTVQDSDIIAENMTPVPRYKTLNEVLRQSRGSDFSLYIRGVDELIASHPTILYEGCNTSFQVHFQIDPNRFADYYNWAQLIAAPVLACATNSPLFLGKRLWRETRIALFHLATDNRAPPNTFRQQLSRVGFGWRWETQTAAEYFKDLVSRYRPLLTPLTERDSLDDLRQGRIPELKALTSLNGTIYAWNRPCYGITEGKPHIRLENRYLPAGPSIVDEVANAALWLGLMNAMPEDVSQLPQRLSFENAQDNFLRAARLGLAANFEWPDRRPIAAERLLLDTLLPMARDGLHRAALAEADVGHYLDIIEQRVSTGRSGSQWILDSLQHMQAQGGLGEAVSAITQCIYSRQQNGAPVHTWQACELSEIGGWQNRWTRVDQLMSTNLITVQPDDPARLIRAIFRWSGIRHLPVESDTGELLGMISTEKLAHCIQSPSCAFESLRARDLMDDTAPTTVTPDTAIRDALKLMTTGKLSYLAVLANGKLIGIVTERDCLRIVSSVASDD